MGQYYRPIIEEKGKQVVYNTYLDGEYECAKLMEQSWYTHPFVNAVISKMYNKPTRVAWVGDYADNVVDEFPTVPVQELYNRAYISGKTRKSLKSNSFTLDNKFLVNHDTNEVLDLNRYREENTIDGYCTHPVSLLTALGNGQGGGDFYTHAQKHPDQIANVGKWAWNTLEITDKKPLGYKEVMFHFYED